MQFLKEYQLLIGPLIGFTGVIVTLVVNAYLARRQLEHNFLYEAKAIKIALKAELEAILESSEHNLEQVKKTQTNTGKGLLVPLETFDTIFKAVLGKLYLLSPSQIKSVSSTYNHVYTLPQRLALLRGEVLTEEEISHRHIIMEPQYLKTLENMLSNFIINIKATIREL